MGLARENASEESMRECLEMLKPEFSPGELLEKAESGIDSFLVTGPQPGRALLLPFGGSFNRRIVQTLKVITPLNLKSRPRKRG